jgi:hypothetical protein
MRKFGFLTDILSLVGSSKNLTLISGTVLTSFLVLSTGCTNSKPSFKQGSVKGSISSKELAKQAQIELENPNVIQDLRDVDMAETYGQALEKSSDAPFEMGGYTFEGVRSFLLDNQEGIALFTERYPTLGDLFDAANVTEIPEFNEGDFDNAAKNLYNVMNGIDRKTTLLGEGQEIGCEVAGVIAGAGVCVVTEGTACAVGGGVTTVAVTHACEHIDTTPTPPANSLPIDDVLMLN